jgi:PAS domain-containing protein
MHPRTRAPEEPAVEPIAELDQIRQRLSSLDDPMAMLQGIFAFSPLGLQIFKASGECLLVNQAFRRIFGAEPPPGYNVLRDEIAERTGQLALMQRAFAGETARLTPVWYDPRDLAHVEVKRGRRVAVEVTFFPLFDAAGNVKHVGVVFKDVTAELLGQERAQQEQDALREEHRLVETLYRIGAVLAAELDLEKLVQRLADETLQLTRAK